MAEVSVTLVGGEQWEVWRATRLRALEDSPAAFGSTYAREIAFTEHDFRSRLDGDGVSVLAAVDGAPAGMGAGFRDLPGWCHVVAMWVDPSWRGHGVGHAVLDRIVAWSSYEGLRTHLDVTVGNDAARRFYERAGFVATGEIRPLRAGSSYSLERMVLPPA